MGQPSVSERPAWRDAAVIAIACWIVVVTVGAAPGGGGFVATYIHAVANAGAYVTLLATVAVGVATSSIDPSIPEAPWMKDVIVVGAGFGQLAAVVLPPWAIVATARWWRNRGTRPPVDFRGTIRGTWRAIVTHLPRYYGLSLLTFVGLLAAEQTVGAFAIANRPVACLVALAAWSIHVLVGAVLLRLCLAIVDGRTLTFTEAVPGPATLLRFGVLCELWTAATLLGVTLLFLPGVVWAAASCFAGLLLVEQRLGFFAALRQSARLTRGLRWRLFKLGSLWLPTSVLFGVLRHLTPAQSHGGYPITEGFHAVVLPAITLLLCSAYRRVGATAPASSAPVARRPWWPAPDVALAGGWTAAAAVPVIATTAQHLAIWLQHP